MNVTAIMIVLASVLLLLSPAGVLGAPCRPQDYVSAYTPCTNHTRALVYYKAASAKDCTEDTSTTPRPIYNLPCNIECAAGEYLPDGATTCAKCRTGTYSYGGGVRVDEQAFYRGRPLNSFLLPFKTSCEKDLAAPFMDTTTEVNCTGWKVGDGFLETGPGQDNTVKRLSFGVNGMVRFEYQCDSEPRFDGFWFEIDGVAMLGRRDSPIWNQTELTMANFTLEAGVHVLSWYYKKDFSTSAGQDSALIKSIEVRGTELASRACPLCPAGTYAPNEGMDDCPDCPADTFASAPGSSVCTSCPSGQFAHSGSTTCVARPKCEEHDFQATFTACRADGKRDLVYRFIEPVVCNKEATALPPNQYGIPCAQCNPGMIRINGSCQPCPEGQYAPKGATSCATCPSGHVSNRTLMLRQFNEISDMFLTSCSGSCDTPGWIFQEQEIDSGSGHGKQVQVSLAFNVTLRTAGRIDFSYRLDCNTSSCHLDFNVHGSYIRRLFVYGQSDDPKIFSNISIPLEAGTHELKWVFHKSDPHLTGRTDKARIASIDVYGATNGGAERCLPCDPGTYAPGPASACLPCPAGQSSERGSNTCSACPANTFAPNAGSSCLPCGSGTFASEDATSCHHDCSLEVAPGISYSLKPLASKPHWGPIVDNIQRQYYVSVCNRTKIPSCSTNYGDSVDATYGCSSNPYYTIDLGNLIAFHPRSDPRSGLIVELTNGSMCLYPAQPRSTNITFVCNPDAGVGQPVPFGSNGEVQVGLCNYQFKWESLYACPVCTSRDYESFFGECKNGKQLKSFAWKSNPRTCHGGEDLPRSVEVPCSTSATVICHAGERYNPELESGCESCPHNTYSLGGGEEADFHSPLSFNQSHSLHSRCHLTECRSMWKTAGGVASAGGIGTMLEWAVNFVRPGKLEFEYKTLLLDDQTFELCVDHYKVWSTSEPSLTWQSASVPVGVGTHVAFFRVSSLSRSDESAQDKAFLRHLRAVGTAWHSTSCKTCPPGFESDLESALCTPCPINGSNALPGHSCSPCSSGQISGSGFEVCINKPTCTDRDFFPVFGPCQKDTHLRTIDLQYDESVCSPSPFPTARESHVACQCPDGFVLGDTGCRACVNGTYESNNTCLVPPSGSAAIPTLTLFGSNADPATSLKGLTMFCEGKCLTSWRWTRDELQSGWQLASEPSSSFLQFKFTPVGPLPSLVIDYDMRDTTGQASLRLWSETDLLTTYPGGTAALVDIPLHHLGHLVSNETRLTLESYHPKVDTSSYERNRFGAVVKQLQIRGAEGGGGVLTKCAAGTFSDSRTNMCSPCEPGTWSTQGSSACALCSPGSWSSRPLSSSCSFCTMPNAPRNPSIVTSCSLTQCMFQDKTLFNLTRIGYGRIGSELTDVRLPTASFLVNLCGEVADERCRHPDNSSLHTHICKISEDGVLGYGSDLNFSTTPNGFTIDFLQGDTCRTAQALNASRTASIEFTCDPQRVNLGQPLFRSDLSSEDGCHVAFSWTTPLACPACVFPEHYEKVSAMCSSSGRRLVSYRTSAASCFDHMTGYTSEEDCTPSHEVSTPIIVVVSLAFVVIIGVAGLLYVRHRRLYGEYTRLRARTGQGEEGVFEGPVELSDDEAQI